MGARAALVKELKTAKRKGDAASVASLRRPTKLAWALGEAARQAPEAAAAFFTAVEALAEPGGDIRRRTADLRSAVSSLVRGVEGVDPGEATIAFLATAADPAVTTALRLGRLAEVPAGGGFGSTWIVDDAASDAQEVRSGDERPAGDGSSAAGEEPALETDGAAASADSAAHEQPAVEPDVAPRADEAAERDRNGQEAGVRAAHIATLEAEKAEAAAAEATAMQRVGAAHVALKEAQVELAAATDALEAAHRESIGAAARLRDAEPQQDRAKGSPAVGAPD